MIKFMRSIWLCTRLILKKMVEKILVQNEFVDFDLELSDFNLFVEIDAPLFENVGWGLHITIRPIFEYGGIES